MNHSCAFTGHRPGRFSFGYDEESLACIALRSTMRRVIMGLAKRGVTTFYTGMALGVDQWAALEVLELKKQRAGIHLMAVRPCETQADRWTPEQRYRYFDVILPACDEDIVLNKTFTPTCMQERNRWLVDHAAHLLAVYDGSGKGGTAYTVRYAKEQARCITTIHPGTLCVERPADAAAIEHRQQFQVVSSKAKTTAEP